MTDKERDKWEKADVIFKAVASILTPLAIASLGYFGNQFLQNRQESEATVRLYTEIMSKREESESALRADMFKSIIGSFLDTTTHSLDTKLLNLELLAYNFQDSINLKPLFLDLEKQIDDENNKEHLARLEMLAKEITQKQLHVLEQVGHKFDRSIDLESLAKQQEGPGVSLDEATLKLGDSERRFRITVPAVDVEHKRVRINLYIDTPKSSDFPSQFQDFWLGFFDFPVIDNTRLSNDERCAIVLTDFNPEESIAEITVVYFPGSYASLKEKPYYEEVIQRLKLNSRPE